MNRATLSRIETLEARQPPELPRLVRVIVDTDREVIGAVVRPGHHLVEREPGEPLEALHARAEAAR